jgi:hypothetical protein
MTTIKYESGFVLKITTLFLLSQEADGEELRPTALTKRALNARQITMVEHDLFKGQIFEDQVQKLKITFVKVLKLFSRLSLRYAKFAKIHT